MAFGASYIREGGEGGNRRAENFKERGESAADFVFDIFLRYYILSICQGMLRLSTRLRPKIRPLSAAGSRYNSKMARTKNGICARLLFSSVIRPRRWLCSNQSARDLQKVFA